MRDREAVISVGSYPADRAVRIPLPQPTLFSSMVERLFVEQDKVVRFYHQGPLPGRLTVGRQILTLAIVVRIHAGQPILHMFITHYEAIL